MKTFFEVIKEVLDSAISDLPAKNRDQKIKAAKESLHKSYKGVLQGHAISYQAPENRFAYVLTYAPAHAQLVSSVFGKCKELKDMLSKDKLVVTAIGGGPGRDILGVVKRILNIPGGKRPDLKVFIIDNESAWGETWADLDDILEDEIKTSRVYRVIDVCSAEQMKSAKKPSTADIITLVFFLSELYQHRSAASPNLINFLDEAKIGSRLLVIDFKDQNLRDWSDEMAEAAGFGQVCGDDDWNTQMPPSEETDDLGEYKKKFGSPKLKGRNFYRVYVKE